MPLFALTLLVSAALLFAAQPMVARSVLPVLGGAPAVWSVCLLFFQSAVLAGYAVAHLGIARLGVRTQAAAHCTLLLLVLVVATPDLGRVVAGPPPQSGPAAWLLVRLAATAGLPVLLLAATAPALQSWFAALPRAAGRDPYPLYVASNSGGLLALLAYPTLVEPSTTLSTQARLWTCGFAALAALTLACAATVWRSVPSVRPVEPSPDNPPAGRDLLVWAALAFVPASLLAGVTTYLTADVAPVPLLWVVPLALYLLSFVVTFARRPVMSPGRTMRLLPPAVLLVVPALASGVRWAVWVPFHLLAFFVVSLACHGELVRRRPPSHDLTALYLALAAGGALGGLFNALVAPAVFDRLAEYPLVLVLACLVPAFTSGHRSGASPRAWDLVISSILLVLSAGLSGGLGGDVDGWAAAAGLMLACGLGALVVWAHRTRPLRFGLSVGAVLLGCGLSPGPDGRVLHRDRSFFGALRVTVDDRGAFHRLFHGGTLHGQQSLDPARRREPLDYYHRTGPVGQVIEQVRAGRPGARVAVVGLGAGALAAYAGRGQAWTFYELDPAVVRVARDPRLFTFLNDAPAGTLDVVVGDARVRMHDAPDGAFDLIVLDAFNSDAVPVHLLTREAFGVYLAKLAPGGIVAVHLSNRYLDLAPVVGTVAQAGRMKCRVRFDRNVTPAGRAAGKLPSLWGVVARDSAGLGPIERDPRWAAPPAGAPRTAWRDDFCDIVTHLRLRPPRQGAPDVRGGE